MPVNVEAKIFVLSEVILAVFEFTVLINVVILFVLELKAVVKEVILAVFEFTVLVNVVILFVLDTILVSKVDIVDEFTPPTVFTEGDVAVPLRSPANWIIPFVVMEASLSVVHVRVPLPVVVNNCPFVPWILG